MDGLTRNSSPAVYAADAAITLYGPNGTRVEFVVDEVTTVPVQIDSFRELVRHHERVGTERAVED